MKFSIIICTHNSVECLPKTLDSILAQSFNDYEVVIVDGASSDETIDVVSDYAKKFNGRLKWISEKDDGIFDAMNKGINIAMGEWVYFMGSDDLLFNDSALENIEKNVNLENFDVVNGNVKLKHANVVYKVKLSLVQILERGVHHQSIFCRRTLFEKFGNFDTSYRGVADWEFNMRWFNDSSVRKIHIDHVVALYNEKGFSHNFKDEQFKSDKNDIIKKHFSPLVYFLYKNKFFVFLDISEKAFMLLKKEGIASFLKNIYNFLVHGRDYFKNHS